MNSDVNTTDTLLGLLIFAAWIAHIFCVLMFIYSNPPVFFMLGVLGVSFMTTSMTLSVISSEVSKRI